MPQPLITIHDKNKEKEFDPAQFPVPLNLNGLTGWRVESKNEQLKQYHNCSQLITQTVCLVTCLSHLRRIAAIPMVCGGLVTVQETNLWLATPS